MTDTDLDKCWRAARAWVANMPLTITGVDLLTLFGTPANDPPTEYTRTLPMRRHEAIMVSAFLQWARARENPDEPVEVTITYDPAASTERPIYGPIFGAPEGANEA